MLYDIILVGIVLLSVFIGVKNGASKTLLSVLAVVGAGVLAVVLSRPLAEFVFESFMRGPIEKDISTAIANSSSGDSVGGSYGFDNPVSTVFVAAMAYFGKPDESLNASCNAIISENRETAPAAIVNMYKPVIIGVVSVIAAIILFVLLWIVLKFVSKGVGKVFKLPLVRVADATVGGLLGFARGVVTVVALALLLKLLAPVVSQSLPFLSNESIDKSGIFSFIYNGGLTRSIQDFIYNIS